jgi:hypothetical protein
MKMCPLKAARQAIACLLLLCIKTENITAFPWMDDYLYNNSSLCSPRPCDCTPFWLDAECLYWKVKESPRIVPLVFTGIFDASVTPNLQTAATKILLGNSTNKDPGRFGLKFSAGYNFDRDLIWNTELNYMFLANKTTTKSVRSNDYLENKITLEELPANSYLAIPFYDVGANMSSSSYIAEPGFFSGKAILKITNGMEGAEWNFTYLPDLSICRPYFHIKVLGGVRYWNFNEKLTFTTHSPDKTTPDIFTTVDQFHTKNWFYGAQMGLAAQYEWACFSCLVKGKLALGYMNERLKIRGKLATNNFDSFGQVVEYPGGYFALPSNIGYYDKIRFASIPEFNFDFIWDMSPDSSLHIGYSFLYVSEIFWAEDQIDPNIDPSQAPAITGTPPTGAASIQMPKALLKSKDFWVQGLNIGFEYRF